MMCGTGSELCLHPLRPQIQCIQTNVWPLFKLINDALCEACYTTSGLTGGSHALRPEREWQEQM